MEYRLSLRTLALACSILTFNIYANTEPLQKELTPQEIKKIGQLIWNNEALGRKDLLVFWNKTLESFPSLGIGHCIWYPQGIKRPFTETFPALCAYLKKHDVTLPAWLKKALRTGAPWQTRQEMLDDTQRTNELRDILAATVDLQTEFMIHILETQWPRMIKATPREERAKLIKNYMLLRSSALGSYALVDYCNFKGTGLNPEENCKGKGWGLLQVLLDMPDDLTVETAPKAFTVSATKMLLLLIEDSAPDYRRVSFFPGWMKRVATYANKKLFEAESKTVV